MRNLCFHSGKRFFHTELGYNYRLTNMQAALGVGQIARIDQLLAHKRWMGETYQERLADLEPRLHLQRQESWARPMYWMYSLLVDESTGMDAVGLAGRLQDLGVQTRPFFLGMHEQPVFQQRGLFVGEKTPGGRENSPAGFIPALGLGPHPPSSWSRFAKR